MMIKKEKKGQIWVETVIYTLIGLALIGLVLAIVTPQINEFRDRTVIEQTIDSLNIFDSKVEEALAAPGNKRVVEFQMKRGELFFDVDGVSDNKITFVMDDSRVLYSEPDTKIEVGRITVLTTEGTKRHTITLTVDYPQDLTFDGSDEGEVKFSSVSVPYQFSIENTGFQENGINIDIKEVS